MTPHPWLENLLISMPALDIRRASIWQRGSYSRASGTVLVRHGLRGPAYWVTVAHEAIHAERDDERCASRELEDRQELAVAKEAARRLIDIHRLAETATAYAGDPHRVAEELDVDYDTLATRIRWLHPSERHYLRERLAACEETA